MMIFLKTYMLNILPISGRLEPAANSVRPAIVSGMFIV